MHSKFVLAATVTFLLCGPTARAQNPSLDKAPAAGVEWTKIQDLNPNATATNRPIKQKWAVVVGASKFQESRLNGMDDRMDEAARNFSAYLIDPNGGRFPESHVKTLINSSAMKAC